MIYLEKIVFVIQKQKKSHIAEIFNNWIMSIPHTGFFIIYKRCCLKFNDKNRVKFA